MTDQEIREMIRESIARHASPAAAPSALRQSLNTGLSLQMQSSHARLPLGRGSDDDGACVIEPAVRCNHCGFCVSFGH